MNRRFGHLQKIALRLAAVALLVNALVPAGFMLHPTGGAGLTVVLCPDQGALPGYSAEQRHSSGTMDHLSVLSQIGDESTCSFSMVAGPLLGSSVQNLQRRDLVSVAVPAIQIAIRPQNRRSSFSVRGPPGIS